MKRINVVGTSCSGKSTLAQALSERLNFPFADLDDLYWNPGWLVTPEGEFRKKVEELSERTEWVVSGNYSLARDILWKKVDTVIWLDHRFSVVMSRGVMRTLRRALLREECCNGNHESFIRGFFSRDSILLWILTTYRRRKEEFLNEMLRPEYVAIRFVRLQSQQEVESFLASVSKEGPSAS